jgi:hypothetical protein
MKSIENEKNAKNTSLFALRRAIDSNKEEAISYHKSIGAI